MGITRKLTLAFFAVLSLFQIVLLKEAIARPIDEKSYYVFQASAVDGGYLYLQAQDEFVLIASDIITPISLGSDTPSYQTPLGIVSALEGQELELRTQLPIFSDLVLTDYLVGDVTGDGVSEIFIPALGVFITGLEGEHGGSPYILAQYSEIDGIVINYYDALTNTLIVKPGLTFDLKDMNGDGRFDLVIKQPGKADQVVSADTQGKFSVGSGSSTTELQGQVGSSADLEGATIVTGAVAGSFSVESGAASYSVQLAAPAGTAGVVPKFALTYNSNGGNGLVGRGWGIAGQTMIARCGKSYLHDGTKSMEWSGQWWDDDSNGSTFDIDAEQNLCLDGEKLVLVAGEYWKSGAEYRTERESFVRVTQHGDSNAAWFEVKHKSGDVFHFGNSYSGYVTGAKATIGSRTTTWAVSRVEDAAGNYMLYQYDIGYAAKGITLIRRVDYTGNDSANIAPYNAVVFDYEERHQNDYIESYNPNSAQTYLLTDRLRKITTLVEGNIFRKYVLGYRSDSEISKLQEIYECNGSGECSMPTVISWTPDTSSYDIVDSGVVVPHFGDNEINKSFDYETIQYPDINGDGFVDICGRTRNGMQCILGSDAGFVGNPITNKVCMDSDRYTGYPGLNYCNSTDNFKTITYLDVDGDGGDDLVVRGDIGVVVPFYAGVGAYTLLVANKDNASNETNEDDNKYSIRYPDINGDALPDLCYRNDVLGIRCFLNVTNTSDSKVWDTENPIETGLCKDNDSGVLKCNDSDNHKTIQYVDVNGDGMDDIFFRSDTKGLTYVLSKGDSFSESKFWFSKCSNTNTASYCSGEAFNSFQFMDLNADGLQDICWTNSGGFTYCFGNPGMYWDGNRVLTWLSNSYTAGTSYDNAPVTLFNDFNQDGRPDVFLLAQSRASSAISLLDRHTTSNTGGGRYSFNATKTSDFCTTGCSKKDVYSTIRFIDTNGDGKQEVVHRTPAGIKIYNIDIATNPGYVEKIENGFGLMSRVEYSDLNDSEVYEKGPDVAYPRQKAVGNRTLVKSLFSSDGLMQDGTVRTDYFYTGLTSHVTGAGSLGFESIKVSKEIRSGVIEENTTYYSTNHLNHTEGMPVKTVSTLGGITISESENFYDTIFYGANDSIISGIYTIFNGERGGATDFLRYMPYTKTNISKRFDPVTGELLTATSKQTVMGEYGDLISSKDIVADTVLSANYLGNVSEPTSGSYLITSATNKYDYNDPSRWFLGKLSETTVTKSGITILSDLTGSGSVTNVMEPITRKSRWTYFSDTGAVKTEEVVLFDESGTEYTDTIKVNEIDISHDGRSYPNLGVPNRTTQYEVIGGIQTNPRTSATFSDPRGRFAVANADTLGNTVYTTYHPIFGSRQTVTGANGLTATWEYDSWGRPVLQTNPDGTWAKTEVIACGQGDVTCPVNIASTTPRAIYYIRSESSGSVPSYAFVDRYGRTVQTRTTGLNGNAIYNNKVYNKFGQEFLVSMPSFSSDIYNDSGHEFYEYDDLGRLTKTTRPGGSAHVGGVETEVLYEGLNQTLFNRYQKADGTGATSQMKKLYFDPFGRMIQSQDYLNNVVQYIYDAYGNKLESRVNYSDDSQNYTIAMAYDAMGRKTGMSDPSKGDWQYIYNKRGELVLQEDGNSVKICHQYDSAGRLVKRFDSYYGSDADAVSGCISGGLPSAEWIYDIAPKIGGGSWMGKLYQVKGENGYQETYSYDALGRASNAVVTIDSSIFITTSVFDELGRVKETFYPSANNANRLKVENKYNANGFLTSIEDGEGAHYWKALEADAYGRITEETYGSGVISTNKNYNAYNGTITNITSTHIMGSIGGLQDDAFLFDGVGNLAYRQIKADGIDLSETYSFDTANRLKDVVFEDANNSALNNTVTMNYKANGNIESKPGVGSYLYGESCSIGGVEYQPSSHALTSVEGAKASTYCYDTVGNLLAGGGRTVEWSSFNKPTRIDKGSNNVQLVYGPDRSRIQRIDNANGKVTRTTYIGKAYEKIEKSDGTLEEKHFIGGFAVVTVKDSQVNDAKTHFLLKDHLGSTSAIIGLQLKVNGDIDLQRLAYDPWGKRRSAINWQSIDDNVIANFTDNVVTNRGFTGHEMLDAVGLVHMNGRVYDPEIGRFLSADPFVQSPINSQSYNRYSYVMNNPVSYTDPSGFFSFKKAWKRLKKAFKKIAKIYYKISGLELMVRIGQKATKITAGVLAKNPVLGTIVTIVACFTPACIFVAMAVSALQTYGVTGDWKLALKAGAIAGATAWVSANYLHGMQEAGAYFQNAVGHGLLSGAASVAQGGKFGTGFTSGFAAAGVANWGGLRPGTKFGNSIGFAGRTAGAAIVGGTISKWTGGKFANGAQQAAIQHLFNAEKGFVVRAMESWIDAESPLSTGRGGLKRLRDLDTKYAPTAKHKKGGWGTEMDLDNSAAQDVLNNSIQGGKQRYGFRDGKLYEFQPDNRGGWHGYPIKGTEAPPSVLKEMRDRGDFPKSDYKKLIKGK